MEPIRHFSWGRDFEFTAPTGHIQHRFVSLSGTDHWASCPPLVRRH